MISVPPQDVLRKRSSLPAAVEENLRQALGLRSRPPHAFQGRRALLRRARRRRAIRRATRCGRARRRAPRVVDPLLKHVAAWGAKRRRRARRSRRMHRRVAAQPAAARAPHVAHAVPPLAVLGAGRPARRDGRRRHGRCPLWQKRDYVLAARRRWPTEARPRAAVSETLRPSSSAPWPTTTTRSSASTHFPAAAVVDTVSKLLPDDTWLTQFELKTPPRARKSQRELSLRGERRTPAGSCSSSRNRRCSRRPRSAAHDQDPAGTRRDLRPRRAAEAAARAGHRPGVVASAAGGPVIVAPATGGARTRRRDAPAAPGTAAAPPAAPGTRPVPLARHRAVRSGDAAEPCRRRRRPQHLRRRPRSTATPAPAPRPADRRRRGDARSAAPSAPRRRADSQRLRHDTRQRHAPARHAGCATHPASPRHPALRRRPRVPRPPRRGAPMTPRSPQLLAPPPARARDRLAAVLAVVLVVPSSLPVLLLHRHYDVAIDDLTDRLERYRRVAAQAPELRQRARGDEGEGRPPLLSQEHRAEPRRRRARRPRARRRSRTTAAASPRARTRARATKAVPPDRRQRAVLRDHARAGQDPASARDAGAVPVVDNISIRPLNAFRGFKPAPGQEPENNVQLDVSALAYPEPHAPAGAAEMNWEIR